MQLTIGVLALQGAFLEHITLLRRAAAELTHTSTYTDVVFFFTEVRTTVDLQQCDALIIPGGESTTISLIAARTDLLESLRNFVKVERKPVWGTCAGLILLSEAANSTKKGGQELIGGLDVRVNRNHFGRQIESFETGLSLPFLDEAGQLESKPFPGVFIRAPIVEKILTNVDGVQAIEAEIPNSIVAPSKQVATQAALAATSREVTIMAVLPGRVSRVAETGVDLRVEDVGDVVAVQQGNVFGTSFHPELTTDVRIHVWWLRQILSRIGGEQQPPT